MSRRVVFALLALAPLAFGGVAVADDDDRRRGEHEHGDHERHEHEEHEEHEHEHRHHGFVVPLPFFGAPASPRYTGPPGTGPYRNDEEYWRGRNDERNRIYGTGPYGAAPGYGPSEPPPPPPPGY